eukprot:COSAG02_NODE_14512_length_1264_cov_0.940773_2_plen_112_part_00
MMKPEPGLPAPVLAALQAARRGALDYESAQVLISWGPDNLPIRPEKLGPYPGGAVFWEQPGLRRARQMKRNAEADTWKNSGGKRPVKTMSDPNGVGPSLDRRAGRVFPKSE